MFPFSQNTNGILAMLDEECLRPGTVTDETFLEKLNQVCATHQHFESRMSKCSRFLNDTSLPHSCFRIQHYAGKVWGLGRPTRPAEHSHRKSAPQRRVFWTQFTSGDTSTCDPMIHVQQKLDLVCAE